jgi:hypothetical protein
LVSGQRLLVANDVRPEPIARQRQAVNWLPVFAGEFEMTIRTYWPKPEVNEGKWTPLAVQKVE